VVAVLPSTKATGGVVAQRKSRTGYFLLLPGMTWLAIFFAIPFVTLFLTSLQAPVEGQSGQYVPAFQISNYSDALLEYWPQFLRSFMYAGIATGLALFIAYPLAYFIAFKAGRWRALMLVLVIAPSFASFLLRTYAWKTILADEGFITSFFNFLHLLPDDRILNTGFAVIAGLTYNFLPFMILPIYASAERFDFRLAEAAYDLGAKKLTVVRKIILPSIRPGIISGVALVFIPALGSFLQSDMLGGGKTNMVANIIANNFGQARNWPFGSALAVLLIVLTLLFILIIQGVSQRRGDKVELV